MAIIKKIDGEDKVIADKSIISHDQLSGREAYGAHPISAIRKLPEKLSALKKKSEELEDQIVNHNTEADKKIKELEVKDSEINEQIKTIRKNAQNIDVASNDDGTVTFTNYDGNKTTVRSGYLPDEDTLTFNEDKTLTLKQVYVDNETIINSGAPGDPLELKNKPDELTIITDKKNSQIYSGAIKDNKGIITPQDIRDEIAQNTETHDWFENRLDNIDSKLNANDIVDNAQQEQINDLFTRTKGSGGYLNAYNFGLAEPTQEELTQYALQDIGITDKNKIFNGTKVRNLYDNHIWILTNTPDSDPVVFSWEDQGADALITDANNNGVHGLVTGSQEHLEGSIDTLGHISINGLEDELDKLKAADTKNYDELYSEIDNCNGRINEVNNALEDAVKNVTDNIVTLNDRIAENIKYNEETYETKSDAERKYDTLQETIESIADSACVYFGEYQNGIEYPRNAIVKYGNHYFINSCEMTTAQPNPDIFDGNWVCISTYARNADKVFVDNTTSKIHLVGSKDGNDYRELFTSFPDVFIDNGIIYDDRGKLASEQDLKDLSDKIDDDISDKLDKVSDDLDELNKKVNDDIDKLADLKDDLATKFEDINTKIEQETQNREDSLSELREQVQEMIDKGSENSSMSFIIRRWSE